MELKVWVEGLPRVVCGVAEETTCQEVVLALAAALGGRTGRYTLVERWRDTEHLLEPTDSPVQALTKWGEYAADVQFLLRYSSGAGAGDGSRARSRSSGSGSGSGSGSRNYNANIKGQNNGQNGLNGHNRNNVCNDNLKPVPMDMLMRPKNGTNIKRNLTFNGSTPTRKYHGKSSHENSSLESLEEQSSFTSSTSTSSPYASMETRAQMDTILAHRTFNGILESEGEEEGVSEVSEVSQNGYSRYTSSTKSSASSRGSTPLDCITTPGNVLQRQYPSSTQNTPSSSLAQSVGSIGANNSTGHRTSSNSLSSTFSSSSANSAVSSMSTSSPKTPSPKPLHFEPPKTAQTPSLIENGGIDRQSKQSLNNSSATTANQSSTNHPTMNLQPSTNSSMNCSSTNLSIAKTTPSSITSTNHSSMPNNTHSDTPHTPSNHHSEDTIEEVYQERLVEVNKEELLRLVRLQKETLQGQENRLHVLETELTESESKVGKVAASPIKPAKNDTKTAATDSDLDEMSAATQKEIDRLEALSEDLSHELEALEAGRWAEQLAGEERRHRAVVTEIHAARAKLAACRSELADRHDQIRAVTAATAKQTAKQAADARNAELKLEFEIAELKQQINEKLKENDEQEQKVKELVEECKVLEESFTEKTRQEEELEKELRDVNLQDFTIQAPPDEDSPKKGVVSSSTSALSPASRPGSARKIYYNPAALKEAIASHKEETCWV